MDNCGGKSGIVVKKEECKCVYIERIYIYSSGLAYRKRKLEAGRREGRNEGESMKNDAPKRQKDVPAQE